MPILGALDNGSGNRLRRGLARVTTMAPWSARPTSTTSTCWSTTPLCGARPRAKAVAWSSFMAGRACATTSAQSIEDLASVHRYDQRACGRSSGSGAGRTIKSGVADLEALRRHFGHERWVVGGHSWGATLALCYALAHPRRTAAALCLDGPAVVPTTANPAMHRRMERLSDDERAALAELQASASRGDKEAPRRLALLFWRTDFADLANAPDFDTAPRFAYPRNAEAAEALMRSTSRRIASGLADEVRTIEVPVVAVYGRDDPEPVEGAVDLARRLQGARLEIIEDAGHLPWLENALRVEAVLRAFLTQLGA